MNIKKNNTLVYLVGLIFVFLIINLNLFKYYNIEVNYVKMSINVIRIIILIFWFILVIKRKIRSFNIGILLILVGHLFEYINNFIITNVNLEDLDQYFLIDIANLLGLMFIVLGTYYSIRHLKTIKDDLNLLAFTDPLTQLPNRNYLLSVCESPNIDHCLNCEVCTYKQKMLKDKERAAFLFIDIDDFKQINDYLGHSMGDLILKTFSKRLLNLVTKDDTVIRISGDEFLMILTNRNDLDNLDDFLNRVIHQVNLPIYIKGKEINISISIGVAMYPDQGVNLESLIKKSDIAMYQAKFNGKNHYVKFQENLENVFNKQFELVSDLKSGIKNKQFSLYYQPKASINSSEITGLEALVRWNHPMLGLITPDQFIPLAEKIRLIDKIDTLVLDLACKQISNWLKTGQRTYNISVNISPEFFLSDKFIDTIDRIFEDNQIDPSLISFEITENNALDDINRTKYIIEKLKNRNIKIYIDDFGKGYSSLNYLKEFKFDYLKLDKSYIDQIHTDPSIKALNELVINLSKIFDFKVVAEGVETNEQLEILKSLGCHEYQGYLLAKPQPIENITLEN